MNRTELSSFKAPQVKEARKVCSRYKYNGSSDYMVYSTNLD